MSDAPHTPDGAQPLEAQDVTTEALNDAAPADSASAGSAGAAPEAGMPSADSGAAVDGDTADGSPSNPDAALAAERLNDLQRLNAEYVNYKRRVDRDRPLIQERAIADVIEALLPVLDDIQGARDHGDLTDGPFAAIADKLENSLSRFGFQRYGSVGEPFDPEQHEALMHLADADLPADATTTTVVQVLQPGYRAGNRVLRPARVAVADPA